MTSKYRWCAGAHHAWRSFLFFSAYVISTCILHAQDPFEIHVLEYEENQPGDFTAEVHTNYIAGGTTVAIASVAPTQDQFHLTYEFTGAVSPELSLGIMQLNGRMPGGPLESAGWRFVPHFYAPKRWRLPVRIGLTAEFSFEKPLWSPNTRAVEILPIIEKQLGRLKFDFNPTLGISFRGLDADRGWDFGLAARVAWERHMRFTPSLEYYSDWGALPGLSSTAGQVHQIVPGGDFHLMNNVTWNVGVGFGLTPSGDRLFYKSRLEFSFPMKSRD